MPRSLLALVAFSLTSILVPNAEAWEVLEGPIFNPATQHAYYMISSDTSLNNREVALLFGGDLVTINDEAEDIWVHARFSPLGQYWIGLNDIDEEGTFVWANDEPVTYTHWGNGEPNDSGGGEDFGMVIADDINNLLARDWDDEKEGHQLRAVVEVVPEPSGILLAGMVVFGVAGLRGRRLLRR